MVEVAWGAASHTGKSRNCNEDATCLAPPVFAVADGMGGHGDGDIAASLIVGALASFEPNRPIRQHDVEAVISATNRLIFDRSGSGLRVMGSTISGLAFLTGSSPSVLIFNVGDSRTYLLEAASLRQVTTDHSHVQELYASGEITAAEMEAHRHRHVITRAIGTDPHVDVDTWTFAARQGQRWLVCSDGLSSELSELAIGERLSAVDPQVAADELIAAVLDGNARDNVSVVVIDVVTTTVGGDPDRTDPRHGRSIRPARAFQDELDVTLERRRPVTSI